MRKHHFSSMWQSVWHTSSACTSMRMEPIALAMLASMNLNMSEAMRRCRASGMSGADDDEDDDDWWLDDEADEHVDELDMGDRSSVDGESVAATAADVDAATALPFTIDCSKFRLLSLLMMSPAVLPPPPPPLSAAAVVLRWLMITSMSCCCC